MHTLSVDKKSGENSADYTKNTRSIQLQLVGGLHVCTKLFQMNRFSPILHGVGKVFGPIKAECSIFAQW
jgi:hypothetical protein